MERVIEGLGDQDVAGMAEKERVEEVVGLEEHYSVIDKEMVITANFLMFSVSKKFQSFENNSFIIKVTSFCVEKVKEMREQCEKARVTVAKR